MSFQPIAKRIASIFRTATKGLPGVEGNILVYIIVVMLIFGVLGVTMVTLFSTSITATAEPSESRRALYLYESGVRYGMSELRNNGFTDATINTLNRTTYNMPPSGRFEVNVFSPWFESATNQTVDPSGSVQLNVAHGEVPDGFLGKIPTSSPLLRVVNNDYINISGSGPQETAKAAVSGRSLVDSDTVQLDLLDDFVVGPRENVCFSVHPFTGGQMIVPIGSLNLNPVALNIFPKQDGAIRVRNCEYFYREARDMGDHLRLLYLAPNQTICYAPMTITADEEIILSPRNYNLTALGRSGNVTYGGDMEHSIGITSHSALAPGDHNPDIAFKEESNLESVLNQVKQGTNPNFITVDNLNKSLSIGGGTGPSLGATWFNDTRNIGGINNYCNSGRCLFNRGIRLFFTLEYTGSGDGFVFTLLNGSGTDASGNLLNSTGSVGGDYEQSEMLGYSGDSRLPLNGSTFLDNSANRGLSPPKIGLEFDGKVNYNSAFERTLDYCNEDSLIPDTRNDPGSTNRDAVQYVFWGASDLDIPCRANNPSYDDNRHDPFDFTDVNPSYDTGSSIESSPAIGSDGTIYVGSGNSLYALNPDMTLKPGWPYPTSGRVYSPTVATVAGQDTIYFGSGDGNLYALSSNRQPKSGFPISTGDAVTTKPAVSSNGNRIYFGSDNGLVYAVYSNGNSIWQDPYDTFGPVRSSPALSSNENRLYFGTTTLRAFVVLDTATGLAVSPSPVSVGSPFNSSPAVGPDGTVFIGNDNNRLYAFNASNGSQKWSFLTGGTAGTNTSSPAVSVDGTVVYIGSSNSSSLYAVLTADGLSNRGKWIFTDPTGPIRGPIAVDSSNSHIYFGSDDHNVYALYDRGTTAAQKWRFSTANAVVTKPAVKADGTVYVGSSDRRLYAINQFANPKSLRGLSITSSRSGSTVSVGGVPLTAVDSEDNWFNSSFIPVSGAKRLWAVRMEVTRNLTPIGGTYPYNLRTWVRQCNEPGCTDVIGTFYADTRIQYYPNLPTPRPPMMEQTINLLLADHSAFERFLFGFTSQTASGETNTATIRDFQLSLIRPNDPTISNDPDWP